jgi:hypothetical protein
MAAADREKEDSMHKALVQKEIRVGIVGADNKASWAKVSHVPAISGLPGLRLAAVATRNEQSAREAAEAFSADRWFSDPFAMIRDDRIDLLTVAVKVPAHRELVLAGLDAGKAIYCEAPLGRSLRETEEMASAVRSQHTAIGLQGPVKPGGAAGGSISFVGQNWTAAKREDRLQNSGVRAGDAFHERFFQQGIFWCQPADDHCRAYARYGGSSARSNRRGRCADRDSVACCQIDGRRPGELARRSRSRGYPWKDALRCRIHGGL